MFGIKIILGILLVVLVVSLIVWWQIRKIRLREKMVEHGLTAAEAVVCVGCDYNLYGLASEGKCPECSCPIHISIPATAPSTSSVEEASHVEKAIPCMGCGNDLRGSRRNQSCETCGAPAWFSVPTAWLRDCDPAWLSRVRSGLTLWLWNLLIVFVLAFVGSIVAGIWAAQANANSTRAIMFASTVATIVAGLFNLLIVWRISTPNPAQHEQDPDARLRQVTRGATIVGLASALGLMLVLVSGLPKLYMYVTSITGMGGLVSSVGVFLYLRDFACRVPDRKLIRSFTVIMWWLCSAVFISQLSGLGSLWLTDLDSTQMPAASVAGTTMIQSPIASTPNAPSTQSPNVSSSVAVSTRTPATQPPLAYSCSTGLVGLVSFGFTIWLVVMLFRLRAAFRGALDDAE